ncbi:MAG TPA: nucleotide exchange factor GrpE [Burkholderiales bacterium]|nr:nucleotide exchange factor GrpE [Burkholderiales bacterium]
MTEPTPQPTPPGPEDGTLETRLSEAEARLSEQREAWLRALADADNARKRAQADVAAAHRFAVERFAASMLPVLDSLEAALAAPEGSSQALREGVELTLKQLAAAFEKAGISPIAPASGTRFDPNRHQALAAVESEGEPNTVVAVMQKGYLLADRVLRPALVTVAKALESGAGNPISDSNLESN